MITIGNFPSLASFFFFFFFFFFGMKQVVNGEVIETAALPHVGVSQLTRRKERKSIVNQAIAIDRIGCLCEGFPSTLHGLSFNCGKIIYRYIKNFSTW